MSEWINNSLYQWHSPEILCPVLFSVSQSTFYRIDQKEAGLKKKKNIVVILLNQHDKENVIFFSTKWSSEVSFFLNADASAQFSQKWIVFVDLITPECPPKSM